MGKQLTEADVKRLLRLDAVDSVINGRIAYSPEFKDEAIRRYLDGETPNEIFRSFGLDPELIGRKRIERCMSRWTEGMPRRSIRTPTGKERLTYKELKRQLEKAKLENIMLKAELGKL